MNTVGTYKMGTDKPLLKMIVIEALKMGYTLIDTAAVYRNEEIVGEAINEFLSTPSNIMRRSDIYITTKIAPKDQGFEKASKAIDESLQKLQTPYIDLLLIHWPGTANLALENPQNRENRHGTWKAMIQAKKIGKVKSIGVSNFTIAHLQDFINTFEEVPAVNQFELHPLHQEKDLVKFCHSHNIFVQSYSTLGCGKFVNGEYELPRVNELAKKFGCTKYK